MGMPGLNQSNLAAKYILMIFADACAQEKRNGCGIE